MRHLALAVLGVFALCSCKPASPALPEDPLASSYSCEGACVPVRFEVQAPDLLPPFSQPYLRGSFNHWVSGDSALALKRGANNVFWTEIDLPEGDSVAYGFVMGYNAKRPVIAERGGARSLHVRDGLVRSDTVHRWNSTAGERGHWPLEEIARLQEKFLFSQFRGYTDRPQTTAELDALMNAAQTAWAQEAEAYFPGFEWLTTGAYLHALLAQKSEARVTSKTIGCHMLEYELPAFQRELDYLTDPVGAEKAEMLMSATKILGGAHCDSDQLSDESWTALGETYRTLPPIVEAYLALDDLHTMTRGTLEDIHNMVGTFRLNYDFGSAIRQGDLERAQRLMVLAFSDPTRDRAGSAYMAGKLAPRFSALDRTREALDVLDFATRQTAAVHVSADTLRAWYERTAGRQGVKHFQELAASLNRDAIEGRGDPVDLSGTYTDLTSGGTFDLATVKGKTVVLDFWATYCGPCMQEIPDLIDFQERVERRDDIVFISVLGDAIDGSATPREDVEQLIEQKGINYVVLYDDPADSIARHFNIRGYPTKYVLDESGRIVSETGDIFNLAVQSEGA